MHHLENVKRLLQNRPALVPVVCEDMSLALFVCPVDPTSNYKVIQRFALGLAPEVSTVNIHEKCPLKITHDLTNNKLAVCLFDGSAFKDIKALSLPNVDLHNIEQILAQSIASEVFNAARFYSQCKNQDDEAFKNCQTLLTCFTPKDKKDATLEDIIQQANAACKKLERNTPLIRTHTLRKNEPEPVAAQDLAPLNAKISTLEQNLALSEQVLKDSADSLTAIKRNNLFAGAAAGAASMLVSVYCLDKEEKVTNFGKFAAATIGFTLGLIPYTRYATIAAAPLIVQKLIDTEVLSKKPNTTTPVENTKNFLK